MWISSRTTSAGSSVPDPIRIGIVAGETSGDILAANPKIMHQMLQVLNQA